VTNVSSVRIAWLAGIAAASALEGYGIAHPQCGLTLSELTRWACRVHTPHGRLGFTLGWALFSAWYLRHVTRVVVDTART
jgi:hypothetical protein